MRALALLFCALSAAAQIAPWPDNLPEEDRAPEPWRHRRSALVVGLGDPHHMLHDAVVAEGDSAWLVGKLDYSGWHKDLEDEDARVWVYDPERAVFEPLGRFRSDSDGKLRVPVPPRPAGTYPVLLEVCGDLSRAWGCLAVVRSGEPAVVFDIDGTLTTSDGELFEELFGLGPAEAFPYAAATVQLRALQGQRVLYVTGRPYWLADRTRAWLRAAGLPFGCLRLTSSNADSVPGEATARYKAAALEEWRSAGLELVAAYGNATSDIDAYAAAGIPPEQTFIIGKHGGQDGTQALAGYSRHCWELQFRPSANPAYRLPATRHPCRPEAPEHAGFRVPGSRFLCVELDPRTDVGASALWVFDDALRPLPGAPFAGDELAGRVLLVPGESVRFVLSGDGAPVWGYEVARIVGY